MENVINISVIILLFDKQVKVKAYGTDSFTHSHLKFVTEQASRMLTFRVIFTINSETILKL